MKYKTCSFYDQYGSVCLSGSFTDGEIASRLKEFAGYVDGEIDPLRKVVVDGKAVDRPDIPHPNAVWRRGKWEYDPDVGWQAVRQERDAKLAKTDFRVIRASEDGKPMSKAWKDYRQALRDITQQPDPFSIEWPVEPE